MKAYAGIGSRRTPDPTLELITRIAQRLRVEGWRLRSGHAPGADQAFEAGAGTDADVFLPWATFEQAAAHTGATLHTEAAPEAYEVAAQHHPGWEHLSRGARALHARNVHQILGPSLADPAKMVVCWTPDGTLDGRGTDSGGTGQALRIAHAHSIPIFNLARHEHYERVLGWLPDARRSEAAAPLTLFDG